MNKKVKVIYTFNDLLEKIKKYITKNKEIELIEKAYNYAALEHKDMVRDSGEEFIQHPLSTAIILAGIEMDTNSICTALLHETNLTEIEITKEFNKDIAFLINQLSKIGRINFSTDSDFNTEYYKKILVGMSEDVRVIIIKLADRLHNMRTLWALPLYEQKTKAKETLEILTPIAHRLGIHLIKSELEDLCLKYLKPDVFKDIAEKLEQTKEERDELVKIMLQNVSNLLKENDIEHEIKGRAKSIYSIYKKLDKGRKFDDIYDLNALRILVNSKQDCYVALGIIHSKYHHLPKRFKDYVAMPKSNLYQSLHTTVFGIDGELFEIQIRTYEMNEIAEHGVAAHWSYKENKKQTDTIRNMTEKKLQLYRNLIENSEENSEEIISVIKEDIDEANIYVFTPKGDVIELPSGSTPIDFAYKVHTQVGDKMIGAIVNNNIVTLDYELKNGDIIKINTNKNSKGPNREWINIAKTSQAKSKIKAFFTKIDKDEYHIRGKEAIEKEARKRKLSFNELFNDNNINILLKELHLHNIDELYMSIGNNHYTPNHVLNLLTKDQQDTNNLTYKQQSNLEKFQNTKNEVIIDGVETDLTKMNLASCCMPIIGDEIIGYITKGDGITVHRHDCNNIQKNKERTIAANWNPNINKKLPTKLTIESLEKENTLMDIISISKTLNINIDSLNTKYKNNITIYNLIILIEDINKLEKFINEVYKLGYIKNIERVIN
jgi:GTP diphosphokinase / guanosine-3',5'-bis(diphosphate) 3'-diphosphatase